MNRRLLSTTISLSALIAATTLAATRPTFAYPVAAAHQPALVLSGSLSNAQGLDPDNEYNLGVQDYNANNYDSAIAHFTNALKGRSSFSDANFNRGLSYEAKKSWALAIADFTKVITKKPNMYDSYVERGRSYAASGDFVSAQKDLTQAQTLKPNRSDAYQVLGDAYFNNKQYDPAIAAYTKFLTIDPKPDPLVYNNRGLANYAAKHYDAAVADFNKFMALDTANSKDTTLFLGDSYMQLKQYPAAIKAYTAYIGSHPNDATGAATNSRALAELQATQYKEAVADYKTYLRIHPDDKVAYNNMIAAQAKIGGLSIADLEAALHADPTNVPIRIQYAKALYDAKKYPTAIEQYNMILTQKPDDSASLFNRGLAEGQTGDHAKAIADFTTYTKSKASDPLGWNSLGIEEGQVGHWAEAKAAFSQYISLNASDIEAYKNRGIAEYNLKDNAMATADLTKYDTSKPGDDQVGKLLSQLALNGPDVSGAITRLKARVAAHPDDAGSWSNLGVAYVKNKNFQEAADAFGHTITLKPDELALFNRGLAYYNLGATNPAAYTKASADATRALTLKPGYPEAQLLLADAEYAEKNFAGARASYKQYLGLAGISPDNKDYAQRQMLRAAIDAKDYAGVIAVTTDLIAANPSDASNYQIRGSAYVAAKNYDLAIPDLLKYTQMKPGDDQGLYNLGVAYSGKKDNANAAATFEKAMAVKPSFDAANQAALAYKALADADQADGTKSGPEYDKGIAMFDKASTLKTGKDSADALFNEAQALEAKAKSTDTTDPLKTAVTVWERYLAAAPNDPEKPKILEHVSALKKQLANE